MVKLAEIGIPNHFMRRLNMREQLVREVEIIPIEVVVYNVAAGSIAKRFNLTEGTLLPRSIVEFYYKSDELDDPMVAEEHITAFGWANPQDIDDIMSLSLRVNDFLTGLFGGVGLKLVDFKLESGASTAKKMSAWCWPTRSAPTIAGCGISRPTRKWTRTVSAGTLARSKRPIKRLPVASALAGGRADGHQGADGGPVTSPRPKFWEAGDEGKGPYHLKKWRPRSAG